MTIPQISSRFKSFNLFIENFILDLSLFTPVHLIINNIIWIQMEGMGGIWGLNTYPLSLRLRRRFYGVYSFLFLFQASCSLIRLIIFIKSLINRFSNNFLLYILLLFAILEKCMVTIKVSYFMDNLILCSCGSRMGFRVRFSAHADFTWAHDCEPCNSAQFEPNSAQFCTIPHNTAHGNSDWKP